MIQQLLNNEILITIEYIIAQLLNFHTTWFIYKKLTGSRLSYWKVFCLSIVGLLLTFFGINSIYYQLIVFWLIVAFERKTYRLSFWGSLFFSTFPVVFTDLFARFTPLYVYANFFPQLTLPEIRLNIFLDLLQYVMIYPAFLYLNYITSSDIDSIKKLIQYRGKRGFLIGADVILMSYVALSIFLNLFQREGRVSIFIAMAVYLLMETYLNRLSHQFFQERSQEAIDTYIYNLEVYNQHIEELYQKVKPIKRDFEELLVELETPLAKNHLEGVLDVYHHHLERISAEDFSINDRLSGIFDIPYQELRSWIVNQVVLLEKKGVAVELQLDVSRYPASLKIGALIKVLNYCMQRAEHLWSKAPNTVIGIRLEQDEAKALRFVISNTSQEADDQPSDTLTLPLELLHLCWTNGITVTSQKELFKTYQIITITS